jgi:hypothetical protein
VNRALVLQCTLCCDVRLVHCPSVKTRIAAAYEQAELDHIFAIPVTRRGLSRQHGNRGRVSLEAGIH